MAKAQRRGQDMKQKVAKRGGAAARRVVKGEVQRVEVTLGDLIAAAFDTVGHEVKKVAQVVSSPAMKVATGRQIIVEG